MIVGVGHVASTASVGFLQLRMATDNDIKQLRATHSYS